MNTLDSDAIRLVRTQDDLYGMHVDSKGDLILHREQRDYNRNTTHFSVNGCVANHAYGTFDGGIAIIADPAQMDVPSGFGQSDVWFHNNRENNLNVGKAVIVAPIGTQIPDGAKAIFYDSANPDARNEAVNNHLKSLNIEPKTFGMWGWVGSNMTDQHEWQIEKSLQLYGEKASKIQFCPHSSSVDDKLDSAINACEGLVKLAREQYLWTSNEVQVPVTMSVDRKLEDAKDAITKFKTGLSQEIVETASGYLENVEVKINECKKANEQIKEKYASPFVLKGVGKELDEKHLSSDHIEQAISEGKVRADCRIFDIRHPENEWKPIADLFPEVLKNKKAEEIVRTELQTPPPLSSGTQNNMPSLPPNLMGIPPLPPFEGVHSGANQALPIGMTPPPLPFYMVSSEDSAKLAERMGTRFTNNVNSTAPTKSQSNTLKM